MQIKRFNQKTSETYTPYIHTNSTDSWNAIHKWDLKFFQNRFKDMEATLHYDLPITESPYLLDATGHHKTITLEQAIDFISQNDRCYIAQQEISMFDGIEVDFDLQTIGRFEYELQRHPC